VQLGRCAALTAIAPLGNHELDFIYQEFGVARPDQPRQGPSTRYEG
jgi:hypothetical protein